MIICITGLTGSGKTTLAQILVKELSKKNYQVFHLTSDETRKNLFQEELSLEGAIDRDFTDNELKRSYNGLFMLFEIILQSKSDPIIITDGTYRKASQRLVLNLIANKYNTKCIFIRILSKDDLAIKRIREKFIKTNQNGPNEYYDIKNIYEEPVGKNLLQIENNGTLERLKLQANELLEKMSLQSYYFER